MSAFTACVAFNWSGRVLVEEACLELVLHETVGTEGETFLLTAQGIQLDEVACDILDFGLRPLFQAFPCPRAQLVQPRRLAPPLPRYLLTLCREEWRRTPHRRSDR